MMYLHIQIQTVYSAVRPQATDAPSPLLRTLLGLFGPKVESNMIP